MNATARTLRIDRNLLWHRAVSLRQRGFCILRSVVYAMVTVAAVRDDRDVFNSLSLAQNLATSRKLLDLLLGIFSRK